MNTWVLNFANTIVGVGVLAIPFCFHVCGIGMAALMVLATNVLTRKTCEYLLKAGQLTRKTGYESLAQHHLGPMGKLVTELGIIGLMLGTLISFQVVIGDLSPVLISNLFGIPATDSLRMFLMCLSSLGVIPLALMRNISSLANMNAMSMGFYCIFIVVVFFMSLKNVFSGLWSVHVNYWRPEGFFHCLPIISLSFSCQSQVFVMYEAIPEQSVNAMMDIINKAIHLVTVMYLSVGVFGYIAFYEGGVRGDILANFPNGILADAIKAGFWVSIIISFPLIIFPLRMSLHSLLFANQKQGQQLVSSAADYIPQNRFNAITLFIIGGTLIVGILIPHIETVLSITGALIGTFLCFVFPAGLYILSISKENSSRTIAKIVFVISIICMVASTLAVLSASDTHAQTEHKDHPGHESNPGMVHPSARLAKPFQMPGNIDIKGPDKAAGNVGIEKKAGNEEGSRNLLVPDAKPVEQAVEKVKKEEKAEDRKMSELNEGRHAGESKQEINIQGRESEGKEKESKKLLENDSKKADEHVAHMQVSNNDNAEKVKDGDSKAAESNGVNPVTEAAIPRQTKDQVEGEKGDGNRIKSREIKNLNEVETVVIKSHQSKIQNAMDFSNTSKGYELKAASEGALPTVVKERNDMNNSNNGIRERS